MFLILRLFKRLSNDTVKVQRSYVVCVQLSLVVSWGIPGFTSAGVRSAGLHCTLECLQTVPPSRTSSISLMQPPPQPKIASWGNSESVLVMSHLALTSGISCFCWTRNCLQRFLNKPLMKSKID